MKKPKTPEEFCWLYAAGCIESRYTEGTLSYVEYVRANNFIKGGVYPRDLQVYLWFPRPFEILAKEKKCTLAGMQEYWRVRHQRNENTPTYSAKVLGIKEIQPFEVATVRDLRETGNNKVVLENAINIHRHDITNGDIVMMHNGIIAELKYSLKKQKMLF